LLFQLNDRSGQVRFSHQSNTKPVVRLGGLGPYLDRLLESFKRVRVIILFPISQAQGYMKLWIEGMLLDRGL
jgi:hypothetical protein